MRTVFASLVLVIGARSLAAQELSGIKTVGGVNPDYTDLVSAVQDLNNRGVAPGGVTFHIRPGTYPGALFVERGGDGTPVVFQRDPAFSDAVLVTQGQSPVFSFENHWPNPIWGFGSGVSHITLRDIALTASNRPGIAFFGMSSDSIVQNCSVTLTSTNTNGNFRAIWVKGYRIGVFGNTIQMETSTYECIGIDLEGSGKVERNRIHCTGQPLHTGIHLLSGEFRITNNLVSGPLRYGLRISTGSMNALHNTILGTSAGSLAYVSQDGSLTSHNNLWLSEGGYCYEVDVWNANLKSNHNLFYSPKIARVESVEYAAFPEWTATGKDSYSAFGDPKLDAGGRLLSDSPARSLGVAVTAVTEDLEGDPRPIGSSRDAGADEFIHPAPDALSGNELEGFRARFNAAADSYTSRARIQVSPSSSFDALVWDSNPALTETEGGLPNLPSVATGQACFAIPYAGPALSGGTAYYWRIRFWEDVLGEPTRWSEPASFTTSSALAKEEITETAQTQAPTPAGGGGSCGLVGLDVVLALFLIALLRRKS